MPIRLLTSGGGTTTIQPTTSASSVTLTVPSVNANVVTTGDTASVTQAMLGSGLAGTGPAFYVSSSGSTSASSTVWTKLQLNTKSFDTATCFDATTNYRFTPNVAGYYQVNGQVLTPSNANLSQVGIYKNGGLYTFTTFYHPTTGVTNQFPISTLVYLNGSTDYIELWGWQQAGSSLPAGATMSGYLVRAA